MKSLSAAVLIVSCFAPYRWASVQGLQCALKPSTCKCKHVLCNVLYRGRLQPRGLAPLAAEKGRCMYRQPKVALHHQSMISSCTAAGRQARHGGRHRLVRCWCDAGCLPFLAARGQPCPVVAVDLPAPSNPKPATTKAGMPPPHPPATQARRACVMVERCASSLVMRHMNSACSRVPIRRANCAARGVDGPRCNVGARLHAADACGRPRNVCTCWPPGRQRHSLPRAAAAAAEFPGQGNPPLLVGPAGGGPCAAPAHRE